MKIPEGWVREDHTVKWELYRTKDYLFKFCIVDRKGETIAGFNDFDRAMGVMDAQRNQESHEG